MFYHIIKNDNPDDPDSDNEDGALPKEIIDKMPAQQEKKHVGVLKNKIKFVSKLLKMQKLLR